MKKIIEIIKKKWLRDTTKTVLLIAILFVMFIGINVLMQKLEIQDIDVTQSKLFTLSDTSKKEVEKVNENVNIYLIGFEEETALVDLIKQYNKENEKITCEVIKNIQDRADLKSKYGITEETQVIILETDERNKILTVDELYTYDYTTYQQIDTSEEKITNAILNLIIDNKPKIYFLTGHNEYSVEEDMTILNVYLQNEVNEVATLDLLVKGSIPEDASLLVISSPQKDILDTEVEMITSYINKGGKILWMNDPTFKDEKFPNIQKILDLYGITFSNGIILEQDTNKMALQSPNYIIPNITSTKATKDIATDGGILLINSGKIDIVNDEKLDELNVINETILKTGETALYRKDASNTSTSKISTDEQGSFIVGTKLTKQIDDKQSVLYAISNNFFTVDYQITVGSSKVSPIQFYNNKDYILNTIAELTNREDSISIRKDTGVVTYTATESQDRIIKIVIFAFPVVIILIGIIIWIIRIRKK